MVSKVCARFGCGATCDTTLKRDPKQLSPKAERGSFYGAEDRLRGARQPAAGGIALCGYNCPQNSEIEGLSDESHHGHVRYAQPAYAAAVWLRLDARAQLRPAGRTQRDLRQMLRWQYALYARPARTPHRALQFPAPALGANRTIRRFNAGDSAGKRGLHAPRHRPSALL